MAALTLAFSSSVINRPALPATSETAFGSSACTGAFATFVDMVVDSVDANAVRRPSGVTNKDRAACRSYSYVS